MSSKVKRNVRLAICGLICIMFLAISFSIAMGRSNSTQDLIPSTTVILGKWSQTQSRGGSGNYTWDAQLLNTNSAYFGWTTGQNHVVILKSGYYQVTVNVFQYIMYPGAGFVDLKRNADVVSRGRIADCSDPWDGGMLNHHFTDVDYFHAGDSVFVYCSCTSGDNMGREGTDFYLSTMSIIRLN